MEYLPISRFIGTETDGFTVMLSDHGAGKEIQEAAC